MCRCSVCVRAKQELMLCVYGRVHTFPQAVRQVSELLWTGDVYQISFN